MKDNSKKPEDELRIDNAVIRKIDLPIIDESTDAQGKGFKLDDFPNRFLVSCEGETITFSPPGLTTYDLFIPMPLMEIIEKEMDEQNVSLFHWLVNAACKNIEDNNLPYTDSGFSDLMHLIEAFCNEWWVNYIAPKITAKCQR
jgi:hypothetical protein